MNRDVFPVGAFRNKTRRLISMMAVSRIRNLNSTFNRFAIYRSSNLIQKCFCSTEQPLSKDSNKGISDVPVDDRKEKTQIKNDTFASLLRNSKFIDLGDPVGKYVVGTIYHVVEDDLYIDFGWKFPTVCRKPRKNKNLYTVGAKVVLLIKDLELSTRFLGSTTDITLCEADCVLQGLLKTRSS